ncbi:MAG: hypothetical protein SGI89_01975, partial [bacterium]|nr:hypothetical protein [bacterium]
MSSIISRSSICVIRRVNLNNWISDDNTNTIKKMNELMSLCIGSDLFSGTIMLVNDGGKEHFSQNLKKMIEENNY